MQAIYDLSRSPVTFDFVYFLVRAERARRESGDAAVDVTIVNGERIASARDRAFSTERKEWRAQSLLAQLPYLLPSLGSLTMGGKGVQNFTYHPDPSLGFESIFKAPECAMAAVSEYIRFGKPYVTITLRDADFQSQRNSNLAEWKKTADWLAEAGYEVVFVPDAEAVINGKIPDVAPHQLYIPAALSQTLRLALYEYANLNCFTSGGPMGISIWSAAPTYVCKLRADLHSCSEDVLIGSGYAPRAMPEAFKWITWDTDDSEVTIRNLPDILAVCKTRLRQMAMPKTFSVTSEDERRAHMEAALKSYKSFDPELTHERTMLLCCYGPSLKQTAWEIFNLEGDVFTVSGAHDYLVGMGITPHGHIEADPRPHKALLISKPQAATTYYIASCCHPDTFAKLNGSKVVLWHAMNSRETDQQVKDLDPNGFLVLGGSNVGLRAMALATGLGYKRMIIFGMDCSFDENGEQHAGFHTGKKQKVIKVHLPDKRWYWTSPSMVQGCEDFFTMLPAFAKCDIFMKGDGLLQHRLRLSQPLTT